MTYKKPIPFSGRIDGTAPDMLRWHQVMNYIDLEKEKISLGENEKGIVFLEFAVDEGVRRNLGRDGARDGAASISKAIANFPVHFENTKIFHAGAVTCNGGDLEKSQQKLAFYVEKILAAGCLPIVFGGGHEVSYGHHLGIKNFVKNQKIGIINFDAHFDLRPVEKKDKNFGGATSGTGFWQIAQDLKKSGESFNYLALGIQKFSNTKLLFEIADELDVEYVFGDDFNYENKSALLTKIEKFIAQNDQIYLTICMDVFSSAYSPGVSAPSPNGIAPDHIFKSCFDLITNCKKLIALDFAETNPLFDVDNRTAKLAASLVFRII